MLKSFTRNYQDNSTEAGFQFTFYCDICNDGYKSSFIESETYKKRKGLARAVTRSRRTWKLYWGQGAGCRLFRGAGRRYSL